LDIAENRPIVSVTPVIGTATADVGHGPVDRTDRQRLTDHQLAAPD
jgi:hypothetical protein